MRIAFLDGDMRGEHSGAKKKIIKYLESRYDCTEPEINEWIDKRLHYLPGDTWPEKWLLETANEYELSELVQIWKTKREWLSDKIEEAIQAGKHKEFFTLAGALHKDVSRIRSDIVRFVEELVDEEFESIKAAIDALLE